MTFKHVACAMMLALIPFVAFANDAAAPVSQEHAGDADRGADAYDENCAVCHANASRILRGVPDDDPPTRTEWLDMFLTDHYAPDDELRQDIIAWLMEQGD